MKTVQPDSRIPSQPSPPPSEAHADRAIDAPRDAAAATAAAYAARPPRAAPALHTHSASLADHLSGREDFRAIARWVEPGASVLDLGCGDGALLALLSDELEVQGYGIEIDDAGVLSCAKRGVNVIQRNLEDGLKLFDDNSFDFAILSQTLQTIHETAAILHETVRVARQAIVSFPNFGYWPHRLSVLQGRMPVSTSLPYQWHNTPNVRVLTIADFEALAPEVGIRICERVVLHGGRPIHWGANWRGSLAVYRVEKR
ncbi:methionine biosynthesis protein MetW [Robbsia andropogonis]